MPGEALRELLVPCPRCDRTHFAADMVGLGDRIAPVRAVVATLTPQEYALFTRMAGGRSNRQLADALAVDDSTIKAHVTVTKIRRKLAMATREEIMLAALIYNTWRCAIEPSTDGHQP